MEVQLTDFENAAYTCFVALLSRAILLFDLNLYIPLSKVDENMQIAHRRDAVRKEKFYFRQCIDPSKSLPPSQRGSQWCLSLYIHDTFFFSFPPLPPKQARMGRTARTETWMQNTVS